MVRKAPTPIRFDTGVAERLAAWAAAQTGLSVSSAVNRLVDEALRMSEHPGIVFRAGPAGRRAGLAGGPDVWEVIRAVRSARAAEPGLGDPELLTMVANGAGLVVRQVETAVEYWSAYPDEIDEQVRAGEQAEQQLEAMMRRRGELLRRP